MTKEQIIDLSPPQNKILQKILRQQIPNKTVWAFGSRVEWKASETSDLDLVAHKCSGAEIADLKEALEESALHCSVDVLNWEDIPDSFRANIKKHYVVVQQYTVPEGWREVKLGDVVKSNSRTIGKNYPHKEILYLDTGSITENRISDFQSYIIAEAPTRAKRLVVDKNIIYSMVRPIQRHYGFIKKPPNNLVVSTGFSVIEVDKKIAEPLFIYFLLSSNQVVKKLDSIAEGATSAYPSLRPEDIENLHVLLPSLSEQKAIAEVLSSLDDKIDLLRRQNKTLEDMAQTLFCKCFVEDAGDDWEKAKLSDEFDIIMGQSPPGHTYNQDSIGMPLFQGNADFQFRFPNDRVYTTAPHRTAQKFDTLVSVRAPVGKQNMARKECCIGRGVAAFRYKKDNTCHTYTYYKINSMLSEIKQYNNTGTVFGAIAKNDFASIYTTLPPDASIQSFEDMAKPIDEKILLNDNQVHTLEKLRDVLLPKLMSGKIRAKQ